MGGDIVGSWYGMTRETHSISHPILTTDQLLNIVLTEIYSL